ncbi:hypothetical protein [Periweissella ghanensis]|nr:hypothetical protein [Periweissella ghanensis]
MTLLIEHTIKNKVNPRLRLIGGIAQVILAMVLASLFFWTSMTFITKIAVGLAATGFCLTGFANLLPQPQNKPK